MSPALGMHDLAHDISEVAVTELTEEAWCSTSIIHTFLYVLKPYITDNANNTEKGLSGTCIAKESPNKKQSCQSINRVLADRKKGSEKPDTILFVSQLIWKFFRREFLDIFKDVCSLHMCCSADYSAA